MQLANSKLYQEDFLPVQISGNNFCQALVSPKAIFPSQDACPLCPCSMELEDEDRAHPDRCADICKLLMKRILLDIFLTILMDPPTILSCIAHIRRMIVACYSVSEGNIVYSSFTFTVNFGRSGKSDKGSKLPQNLPLCGRFWTSA